MFQFGGLGALFWGVSPPSPSVTTGLYIAQFSSGPTLEPT